MKTKLATLGVLCIIALLAQDVASQDTPWDVNQDGIVDLSDLLLVANHIGVSPPANPRTDVNADGHVNIQDLVLVANHLGETTAPEGIVLIPAGEVQLGSDSGKANEVPVHTRYVNAFHIDAYPVTNADYKKFVDAHPEWQKHRIPEKFHDGDYLALWNRNAYPSDEAEHPVVYVSWYAAMAYAQWAGKRLPTEAEWEKAARGGLVGKKYPWGDTADIAKSFTQMWEEPPTTIPVGQYPPNGYGLYDMTGTVWQWCLDSYLDSSNVTFDVDILGSTAPLDSETDTQQILANFEEIDTPRVLRGGVWSGDPRIATVTVRDKEHPGRTLSLAGFRCVQDASP